MEKIELIDRGEDGLEKKREIVLKTGERILIHEESAYEDYYPGGRSLDLLEEGEGERLLFSHVVQLHQDGIKQLAEADKTTRPRISANPMMVHHQAVMWLYMLTVQREDEGGECRVLIESLGPSFKPKGATPKGAFGNNTLSRQVAPKAEMSCVMVLPDGTSKRLEMTKEGDDFRSAATFPTSLLQKLVEGEMATTARIRVEVTVPRDYFELKTIKESTVERPERIAEAEKLLETVLKGEKPAGWDWVITVGHNDGAEPRDFFVHGKVLAHSSPLLEVAMKTHNSVGKEQLLLMVSHENRFILPQAHSSDMAALLTYFYLRCFILPRYNAFARVGRLLCNLLPPYAIGNMFLFWEEALIEQALSLDLKDYKKTIPELGRHLVGLYSSPYGAMPAAKRVLVSRMADCWHMAESLGVNLEEEFGEHEVFKLDVIAPAYNAVHRYAMIAASVDKKLI